MNTASILLVVTLCASLFACSRKPLNPSGLPQQYTEDDVRQFVLPGATREAIIRRFGEPQIDEKHPRFDDGSTNIDEIMYFFLPEPPFGTKEDFVFGGFQVGLKENKALDWSSSHRSIR